MLWRSRFRQFCYIHFRKTDADFPLAVGRIIPVLFIFVQICGGLLSGLRLKHKAMNKIGILLATLLCAVAVGVSAQVNEDSLALVKADWHWKSLGKKAKAGHAMVEMFGSRQSISVIKYPARKFSTAIIDSRNPNHDITPRIAERHKALAAINASYFDIRQLVPTTYFAVGGKKVADTSPDELFRANGYVAVCDDAGHSVEIAYIDTAQYDAYPSKYKALLASGPVVLHERQIPEFPDEDGFYNMRHPRTMIGCDSKYVYFVVVDGRFPGQGADGATIPEMARVARYLGMENALNLDGGGSSTAWTRKTGVLNHPSDNRRFDHEGCRKVPNIIIMK